ncbi:hypothetical protein Ancab_033771 [Ancistrocladus abbreviatus]
MKTNLLLPLILIITLIALSSPSWATRDEPKPDSGSSNVNPNSSKPTKGQHQKSTGSGGNTGGGGSSGGGVGGFFGPGGRFSIPGFEGNWPGSGIIGGGYGAGYGGPAGGRSRSGIVRPSMVCKEKGPCYMKKLTCPSKCFTSYSGSGKGYGSGGGGGGCTMDCKKKCLAYC